MSELMSLQEIRASGTNVPRQVEVHDIDRFHEVFPECDELGSPRRMQSSRREPSASRAV